MKKTKVSCVILNYNDSETVLILLEQIVNYESIDNIIVVDNNSKDDSYKKLYDYAQDKEKVHVINSGKNGGYGYGNNFGIKYAKKVFNPEYVLISNPDVFFSDDCVFELIKALEINEKSAISSAVPYKNMTEIQNNFAWKLPSTITEILSSSTVFSKILRINTIYPKKYLDRKKYLEVDVVNGSMFLVKLDYMLEFGMFDESFFLYQEEQVLATRFKNARLSTILVADQPYIHNHSISINKSFNSELKKKRILFKSRMLYLRKYKKASWFMRLFFRLFILYCLAECYIIDILKAIIRRKKC